MQGSSIVSRAAKAASYNMLLQFSLRISTFVLNGFILRHISQEMLGIVNVRLTLLFSTTLFLSKEAFEKACLSQMSNKNWRQVINLLWCTFPLSIFLSGIFGLFWLYVLETPSVSTSDYTCGVIIFGLSTVIESLAEPLYVVGQAFMFIKLKVVVFGLAQGIKCIIIAVCVLWLPDGGIINFAIAQLVSSISYVFLYYAYFAWFVAKETKRELEDFPLKSVRDFTPRFKKDEPFIDSRLQSLTISFLGQSFLKQLLTEGEKYVMTFFNVLSFGDQGIYDIINNLGSMAARFIFLPIEENSYLLFSQLLMRGVEPSQQKKNSLQLSARVLGVLLKIVMLIGAIIVVFGYSNSYLALHIYGGNILSSGTGPTLLRWYCLYVLVIAINGTTEAFTFAAMQKSEVDRYNHKMLLFSGIFLLSSWYLTKLIGSVGFILANCLNMGARIVHSVSFIGKYFKNTGLNPLPQTLPSFPVCLSLLMSFVITSASEYLLVSAARLDLMVCHVLITASCLLVVLLCIYKTEHNVIALVKEQFARRKKPESDENMSKKNS